LESASLSVSSLSAPPSPDVTDRIPLLPLPVCRFSQPLDETTSAATCRFIPPRRHSQGYGSSESDPGPMAGRSRPACFFTVALPSMVSFRQIQAFHRHAASGISHRDSSSAGPLPPCGGRLHRGLEPVLKL
jgi:hypothetical protein